MSLIDIYGIYRQICHIMTFTSIIPLQRNRPNGHDGCPDHIVLITGVHSMGVLDYSGVDLIFMGRNSLLIACEKIHKNATGNRAV